MKPTPEAVRITEERKRRNEDKWRDWTCLRCNEHRFACNIKCFKCRTPKPTMDDEAEHRERERAQAQAKEDAKQRALDAVAANERRLSAAVWDQVRLALIGAHDPASALSRLPMELVVLICRWATVRPECWASSRLAWFKATARASPTGVARVSITASECNIDVAGPYSADGFLIEYHLRAQPGQAAADELFTIHKWHKGDNASQDRSEVAGHWTEARFLTKASYDSSWNWYFTHKFTH